jgi:hypothetical protein
MLSEMELFIAFTEQVQHPQDAIAQGECYKRMLLAVANETWHFPPAYQAWRSGKARHADDAAAVVIAAEPRAEL